jgi:hypothetical protein
MTLGLLVIIWFIGTLISLGWGVDSVSSFFNVLYSARVGWEGNDKLCWMPSKRIFEVKYFYKVLTITLPSLGRAFGGLRLL